ncbi:MAG: hypothetical protein FWE17_03040 [Alphaproteobacteria bacterium]|nr:hypothetical protein [Alphaproteobacteria bacterium]MCL2758170.1 hypothetical protein [Alphaproteobacteria bacterium]
MSAIAKAMANHKARERVIKKAQAQSFVAPEGYLVINEAFYSCPDEIMYNGQKVRHKRVYNFHVTKACLADSPKMNQKGYGNYGLVALHFMTTDAEIESYEHVHNGKVFTNMRVTNPEYSRHGRTMVFRAVLGTKYNDDNFRQPKSNWVLFTDALSPVDYIGDLVKELARGEQSRPMRELIAAFPRIRG